MTTPLIRSMAGLPHPVEGERLVKDEDDSLVRGLLQGAKRVGRRPVVLLQTTDFLRNNRLQTTAPEVWATGECAGSPQFTHVGEDDCRVVLDNLTDGSRTTRGRLIPYCLFTDPELAHVGLTESEVRTQGVH